MKKLTIAQKVLVVIFIVPIAIYLFVKDQFKRSVE